jgi:molecular chaperone GrpE (heat shock protein)
MPNPYKPGGPLLPPKPQLVPQPQPQPTPSKKSAKKHTRRRGKKAAAASPAATKTPNALTPYESPENKHEITAAIDDEIEILETIIEENKEHIAQLEAKIRVLQLRKSEIIGAIHKLNTTFGTK